jgi:hypothetical protein
MPKNDRYKTTRIFDMRVESVDKVATLLAEMPLAENMDYFRTALYSRQYHPRALENRFISGFRL